MANNTAFASGKKLYLAKKLTPDGTLTVTADPKITHGRLYFQNDNQEEWIEFTTSTLTSGYYVLGGLTRDIDPDTVPITSLSTGKTWLATQECYIVEMHDQIYDRTQPEATTFATTAARDTALGADGAATKAWVNIYVTATGLYYDYNLSTGLWATRDTGTTTPNASTTVAGKGEIGTQTEVDAGIDIGGTGAYVTVIPSTFQAGMTARIATEAQAETGTSDTTFMTPLKNRESDNVLTLTAGENVSAGAPVYLNITDGYVYNSDANVNDKTDLLGFVITSATTGNPVNIKTKGIFITTGLTPNVDYFLSDTVGTIQVTSGTNPYRVGTAISATQLLIDPRTIIPDDYTIASATTTDTPTPAPATYTKFKEIVIPQSGLYQTYFSMTNNGGGGGPTCYGRIYKGGVAYGTERSIIGGGGTVTYTENLFFLKGELIQLYAKGSGTTNDVTLTNLSLKGLFTTPVFTTVNDA